ncbi:hypothetical protein BLOT_010444 [Blomia tropicalis]|nr:hypothetical protein BLOT_010444 [Blomia tropicalis]
MMNNNRDRRFQLLHHRHRIIGPSDLPEIGSSSANLNSQRTEIESWLMSVEKRFADFVQEYNHHSLLSTARRSSGDKRSSNGDLEASSNLCTKASLSKQLTIISNYQTELNQYSAKLSTLSNSIDARIASLAPKGSDISKSNISMPYYDHLIELRKHADEMQIRLNDLYLSMKCKLRSLQEIWNNCNNLTAGNGIHGGSSTTVGVNSNSTAASSTSSGSGGDSGSASASSQATAVAGCAPLTGPNCYSLHEQTEKRFAKWLAEIEQSLQFIEKRMEAESAINNGSSTANDGDDPLYSNVSEMQQMHMNYFEKVKIMQREIEQKRTDHRILMELLDSESESDQTTSSSTTNTTQQQKMVQQQQHQRTDSVGKRTLDPWLNRFRTRVETLNTRWNSIRLRVLTLRSRLESSSIYSNNSLTTTVQRPLTTQSNSASLYSMTNGYGMTGIGRPPSAMEIDVNSMAATMAFSSAASERATQLLLSLRELVEWIIKRQTEFESQQIAQQQAQLQHQARTNPNVPLDVANVLNQKSSLMQLRVQLADKRPIIDSSLIACHNLLRRLALKRAQDVQQAARMSASASIASSIGGNSTNQPTPSGDYDPIRMNQIRAVKRTELAELENSLTREMQRLLDIWNSLQVDVEMRIQRLDDAHLRLTDLQRAMEDLGAKLHEAEYAKSQWIPISEIPYDQIPQQKALLKNYSQLYVSTIARDAVHVNELSARLTGRNVPLSHANLKSLEEVTTRARLLHVATDERARELEQAIHDHGNAQQHFLTEAVEAPWERAVTANKLPCYINRTTESVHIVSPKYTEIMASLIEFNRVRYAAYRTAMKLRSLQSKFGLDHVTLEILAEAFEQHGLGPNAIQKKTVKSVESQPQPQQSQQTSDGNSATNNGGTNLTEDINEDLPYELRLIAVPDIVSCLKMIFEMVASTQAAALARSNDPNGTNGKKSKKNKSKEKDAIFTSATMTTLNDNDMANNGQQQQQTINVPLCVDLCLNWVLALYDAPSRSGYIRQFSFQVAMILLSKISLEQKYLYLFNLIGNDNGRADERRLGLLIYDCLRLPKLLGEVAAFGGTNIEPSIRSCLEMAGQPLDGGAGVASVCAQDVLNWVRAEPQSLVWLLVLHRLRLAERSRHPAKCNLCRCYPIVGFRYRCLKCFNFDLCQECFLCDMATKKHKSSHPIQEYCVATTSGEDMKDFTKILRNKFKSGRYFKRHQALGYLPVQSLHEGDRIEESASQYVQTMPGSYSHNPSANTTPVHTLPYPLTSRAASPGALTQRDLDFVLDTNGARFGTMPTNQPMVYGRNIGPSVSTIGIRQQQQQQQAFIEQHHQPNSSPYSVRQVIGPFDRRLPQYHSTPVSPINRNRSIDDEVHSRLGQYANKLAEVEMINRGGIVRSHSQRNRGTKFDSLPSGAGNGNIYPIGGGGGRSRTMLVTEYNQLKDEPTTTKTTTTTTKITNTTAKKKIEKFSSDETDESRVKSDDSTELSSPLYENVKNSLERRQRERINNEQQQQQQQQQKNRSINGDGNDQTKIFQESALNGEIPPHLLEEVRRLRENKSRMETRKDEMERCNLLLESQLSQFKQYINNSGALDPKTKARLAQSIVDMERMLDSGTDCSTPASPTNKSSTIMGHDWRPTKNGTDSSDSNTRSTNSSQRTSTTIQSALLNTAAGRVNNAMEHLVDAITDSGDGQQQSQQQQQQLNRFNGSK